MSKLRLLPKSSAAKPVEVLVKRGRPVLPPDVKRRRIHMALTPKCLAALKSLGGQYDIPMSEVVERAVKRYVKVVESRSAGR